MNFNLKDGSSALVTIMLMIVIITVAAFGFIILINYWNTNNTNVSNDPNLTGITTSGDIYNGTNLTLHGLSNVFPSYIFILLIFLAVVFITILAVALKRH